MDHVQNSTPHLQFLSELLLASSGGTHADHVISSLNEEELEKLKALAITNHVIMRSFKPLAGIFESRGLSAQAQWSTNALNEEQGRIDHALGFLARICSAFERAGSPVTVIKSLDHWPDLGSDLDLYADAEASEIVAVMGEEFNAKLADRSWGDRLANKWNFIVPGLPELIEVHVGRLGQTGEQTSLSRSLSARSRTVTVGSHSFRVPAPEDRFVVSTLQRMYRHFYIRLCDIVDNALLLDARHIDFEYLHSLGSAAGLWEGIATYLTIISGYVEQYRGFGVPLPSLVTGSAKFGVDKVHFRRDFLRVPILPHSLNLYAGELKTLLLKGDLRNSFRLSLLPGLATAAALEQKITGSDKGIW